MHNLTFNTAPQLEVCTWAKKYENKIRKRLYCIETSLYQSATPLYTNKKTIIVSRVLNCQSRSNKSSTINQNST